MTDTVSSVPVVLPSQVMALKGEPTKPLPDALPTKTDRPSAKKRVNPKAAAAARNAQLNRKTESDRLAVVARLGDNLSKIKKPWARDLLVKPLAENEQSRYLQDQYINAIRVGVTLADRLRNQNTNGFRRPVQPRTSEQIAQSERDLADKDRYVVVRSTNPPQAKKSNQAGGSKGKKAKKSQSAEAA